jgi:predicted Rossmann-fold nucleotide-binding protein
MHNKPVVILDPWGDFAPLREQIEQLVAKGFMRREAADELAWCVNVGDALDHVARSST